MKTIGLLLAVVLGLSGQSPASSAATPLRQLVYQFGFNTKAAKSGQGTGTTTISLVAPASDGGMMVSGTDFWWNTVRARATNTCEVYPNGSINCSQAPYGISPMQLVVFSLLGRTFFKGLNASGTSSWTHKYQVSAAIVPGAAVPFAGNPYTWDCVSNLQGKGPVQGQTRLMLVQDIGTMTQQGGRYRAGTFKTGIIYDPVADVPVVVDDTRTHLPQSSIYNTDYVSLKLLKDSGLSHS